MGEQSDEKRTPMTGANVAWSIISVLVSGLLVWGGIGWLLDWWLGTELFLPTGLIVGAIGSTYLVIKRFGQT